MDGGISSRAINKLGPRRIEQFLSAVKAGRATKRKLTDGGGMYLTVTDSGTPVWRIKYRILGVERSFSIGTYPRVGLQDARAERDAIKALLKQGRDPVKERQLTRATSVASSAHTFESLAADWLAKQKRDWSAIHYAKSKRALERDVYPFIGRLPVGSITSPMICTVVEAILKRGARETAARVLQQVECIFNFARPRGLLRGDNPATSCDEIIPAPTPVKSLPALTTNFGALGDVLRRAEVAHLTAAVRMAHRLIAFTATRISNVVEAQWTEFDLEAEVPTWTIPRAKMKRKNRHYDFRVPLCLQIATQLRDWRQLTGGKGWVFPSPVGKKHVSRESLEKAYRQTMSLRDLHSPHGWRSALNSLGRDHRFDADVTDAALDHAEENKVVRAYDRGDRFQERVKLMAWWGEQLDAAQRGADIRTLRKVA